MNAYMSKFQGFSACSFLPLKSITHVLQEQIQKVPGLNSRTNQFCSHFSILKKFSQLVYNGKDGNSDEFLKIRQMEVLLEKAFHLSPS